MMDIRLMAFDLDGTLLDGSRGVPARNAWALRAAADRGIRLMLCSGRAFEVQAGFAADIGIDPIFASANGARIDAAAGGPILEESPMDPEMSREIFTLLMDMGVYFMAYARGRSYMFNIDEQKRLKKHHHAPGITMYGGLPFEIVGDEARGSRECWRATYKYVLFGEDYDPRFEGIRGALDGRGLSISSSWRDNMEIMRPGVDKGYAIRRVCAEYGIPVECVMAFGDNANDLPMLETAGWPVVMGNGEECALRAARIIAPPNHEAGVGAVIEEYVLGANT